MKGKRPTKRHGIPSTLPRSPWLKATTWRSLLKAEVFFVFFLCFKVWTFHHLMIERFKHTGFELIICWFRFQNSSNLTLLKYISDTFLPSNLKTSGKKPMKHGILGWHLQKCLKLRGFLLELHLIGFSWFLVDTKVERSLMGFETAKIIP